MWPVDVLSTPTWQQWTWALLHSLWQGMVVVAGIELTVQLLRIRAARARYALSLSALFLVAMAPPITFVVLSAREAAGPQVAAPASEAVTKPGRGLPDLPVFDLRGSAAGVPLDDGRFPAAAKAAGAGWREWLAGRGRDAQPYLALGWVGGVLLLSTRLMLSVLSMRRLRRDWQPVPDALARQAALMGRRLGLMCRPLVVASERATVALTIGLVRPMVLLPASWLGQTAPEVLEAAIAHELAHIRRWDPWVIVFQRVVEALLFFHPAVWWLSRRLAVEREMCCDELAVSVTGRRVVYLSALERVARWLYESTAGGLAPSMAGSRAMLLDRVRYLLGISCFDERTRWWPASVLVLAVLGATCWLFNLGSSGVSRGAVAGEREAPEAVEAPEAEEETSSDLLHEQQPEQGVSGVELPLAAIEDDALGRPLYLIDADGSNLRLLLSMPEYTACGSPLWSSDGTKIAFDAWKSAVGEDYGDAHVFVVSSDGTLPRDLGPGAMPSWSPRGKRITFSQYSPNQGVWIMNADGSDRQLLDSRGWSSRWSPDGTEIAYVVYGEQANICVYDVIEGQRRLVLDEEHRHYRGISHGFTWSPDGKWLCFRGGRGPEQWEVAIVHADGSRRGFRVRLERKIAPNIAWSPDGQRILVPIWTEDTKTHQIYALDCDSDDPPKLLAGQPSTRNNMEMGWSPDGKTIVFPSALKP